MQSDDDLIRDITPHVLGCLNRMDFFAQLDDHLCPSVNSSERASCHGDFRHSQAILKSLDFDQTATAEVVDVLRAQGACCDCEVLYNVAGDNRLKAQYWSARAESYPFRHEPK